MRLRRLCNVFVPVVILLATSLWADDVPDDAPWKVNPPIVTVKRELYKKHPKPRTAALVTVQYVGPKLERMEWHGYETTDDVWDNNKARWSRDNGRTWSEFVDREASTNKTYKGVTVWEGGVCRMFDPTSGMLVEAWLRQIQSAGVFNNFTYIRLSKDLGRTWSEPKQLRYEPGEPFDPNEPLKSGFLKPNQCYSGNNILVHSNGTLIHCVGHANAPVDPQNEGRAWKMAALCFIGKCNADTGDYDWTPGQRIEILPDWSSRGLMESEVAELKDGRVLVVWRGSNTAATPGRKWFSVSSDGGRTLSPVAEWKYDDGSQFYSPSSYHRIIRHSVTGKLYWIGNMCPTPPSGNSPRYPLVIAEIDESVPAIKKKSVTAIDDRQPGQGAGLQFSNFSLLENRETHDLELHLTTYGQEEDPADWASADNYKYTLTIKAADPPSAKAPDREPRYDPIEMYTEQSVEGWRVLVHQRLFDDEHAELREQTLKVLGEHLFRVARVVPAESLAKLREVPIWIELAHPRHPCMCYHVSPDWLREHDMNPAKAGAVELANCKNFLTWTIDQPWMVLHELAHAYHHRVLGHDNAEIRACYRRAVESKSYDSVLHIRGGNRRHYALNNDQEYFAEATEAYFGTNDFYPFVRAELKQHDPELYALIEKLWGVRRTPAKSAEE